MEIWNDKLKIFFFNYLKIEAFIIIFIHLFVSYIIQFIELNYSYYYYNSFLTNVFDFLRIGTNHYNTTTRKNYRFFIYYFFLFYFASYFVVRFFRSRIANDVKKFLSDSSYLSEFNNDIFISEIKFSDINENINNNDKNLLLN
ncbi:MAG: hypothetical protein AM1032_000288 [Mycoplasmataceae bacterium]|nr:MAG: hypothetical protein AM1032_000288 [Mycoplasmataceae bacterium]